MFGSVKAAEASTDTLASPALPVWPVVLATMSGAVLVASMVKVCATVPPYPSLAVTTTVYVPSNDAPAPDVAGALRDALWSIVPVILPVVVLIDNPVGRPVAE